VQQVGSPRQLYQYPANLFVAAFIGSPAMNFLPAQIEGDSLTLPMLSLPLPVRFRECRDELCSPLIAGIRPEHFYPVGQETAAAAASFEVSVGWVEWLGADAHVYFDANQPAESAGERKGLLDDLDVDSVLRNEGNRSQLMARIDSSHRYVDGQVITLGIDVDRLCLFDKETGARIIGRDEREAVV
jgi:multiple sugar transport system ATP-binding protein